MLEPGVEPLCERKRERRGNDAHHLVGLAVDDDRLADDRRVGVEARAPQRLVEDHDTGVAGPLLLRPKRATEDRLDAEQREEVVPDVDDANGRRLAAGGHLGAAVAHQRDVVERRALQRPMRARARD